MVIFKMEAGGRVCTLFVSKICTLGFGGREGEAIL